jgi:hypothetical protein
LASLTLIPLCCSAVAAFKFLAAAARTQFVAANFRLIAVNRFGGFLFVFVRVEVLYATAGSGCRAEELFYFLLGNATGGNRLRNHLTRWNWFKLRAARRVRREFLRRWPLLDDDAEHALNRFFCNIVLQRLEDFEGFLLILHARIFLAVTAQTDACFEVIHHPQVIHPLPVDDRQQQIALFDHA